MPGGVGNITRALAEQHSATTNSPSSLPGIPAATSVVAEKALNVAATMLNNLFSTAVSASQESPTEITTDSTSTLSTTTQNVLSTEAPLPPMPEQHAGVFIYGFCLVLIPTATILGNLLVIISVLRFKALHSAINFLILGLAVADLLVGLFVMPYAVYVYVQGGFWFLGPLMCDIYSASDVACSTASILLLAVISFDRYRAVSRPIQYSRQSQNIRRVIFIIIAIWLISLALASPIVLGVNYRPADASPYECRFYNPEFSIGSSIVSFVIPCFVVLFVYIRIMMALRKREKAAKLRRLANQQETNKKENMSSDENDAGQIVTAPAINVLMLALPTIEKRMRRFERHQKAVQEAGELFNRISFARTLFVPRAMGILSAQSYLLSSVASSTSPSLTNLHTRLTSPQLNNKSARLSPATSPFSKNEIMRRKSMGLGWVDSPLTREMRRQSQNPSAIASTTHALSSVCFSAVAAASVSENEATPRRCRFSSFTETKEYDVDYDESDKPNQGAEEYEEEEVIEEVDEDEDESGTDEFFEDDDFSIHEKDNRSTAKQLFSKVGSGIQNLTDAAVAAIGSRHRLSLAEPTIRRISQNRKLGINQSTPRNSFLGHSPSQALGFTSLFPLLASHESFRRSSDSASQTIRSKSTVGFNIRQTPSNLFGNSITIENDLRPFSTSLTTSPEASQTLTPRASPATLTSPLLLHRGSDAAKSSISATSNSYLTFSPCGRSLSARSSPRGSANISSEELVLSVANFGREDSLNIDDSLLASIVSPSDTTTTTIAAEISTPLTSPTQESVLTIQSNGHDLERKSSTIRRCRKTREKIWQQRANFFQSGNYATEPLIHSNSPLMLRRFVLDVDNDPQSTDEHDIVCNSSSPLDSSDSLSENVHVVTNDFVSEAPTSMSRKSSELDSSGLNHSPPTFNNNVNRLAPPKEKSPKQDSVLRSSVRRFKSFHVNHKAIPLPSVGVSKATADLLRHLSRKSPRLFRASASPSSVASVPVNTTNNIEKTVIRKKLSYTSGDSRISRTYGVARRKSESYTPGKTRNSFRFSKVGSVKILTNHSTTSPIQEIGIPLMSNSNNSPLPERKSSKRYPGTLTSSTLCEELDYVDIDSMHDSQTSRLNGGDSDGQVVRGERSPIPYSEETTSSATDVNPTSPIQTISAPIIPSIKQESKQIGALIIQNQSAADIEHTSNGDSKISRSNGKTSSRDEGSFPSVTFNIPGKDLKPIRRLSSAIDVLESTKLLEKPPIPNSQSSNSVGILSKHGKPHKRSLSQKLSSASTNLITGKGTEHSVESCYSSSQSQANVPTPAPTKNLESKLKMVKRAINRKESSLKRKVNKAQRKEKRATKTLGIVVGIFLVCWVPFFSINILNAVCILLKNPSCEVGFSPFFYSTWLGYTNSFINPIIYCLFNTEFRRAFRSLLVGRSGRTGRHRARHV